CGLLLDCLRKVDDEFGDLCRVEVLRASCATDEVGYASHRPSHGSGSRGRTLVGGQLGRRGGEPFNAFSKRLQEVYRLEDVMPLSPCRLVLAGDSGHRLLGRWRRGWGGGASVIGRYLRLPHVVDRRPVLLRLRRPQVLDRPEVLDLRLSRTEVFDIARTHW